MRLTEEKYAKLFKGSKNYSKFEGFLVKLVDFESWTWGASYTRVCWKHAERERRRNLLLVDLVIFAQAQNILSVCAKSCCKCLSLFGIPGIRVNASVSVCTMHKALCWKHTEAVFARGLIRRSSVYLLMRQKAPCITLLSKRQTYEERLKTDRLEDRTSLCLVKNENFLCHINMFGTTH